MNILNPVFQRPIHPPIFLDPNVVRACHITLPNAPKPISAILYRQRFYGYVRSYPTQEDAQRGADRLAQRGSAAILTQVRKGFILWVLEPDATLITKSTAVFQTSIPSLSAPKVLDRTAIRTCHIVLPDTLKPVSAILYNQQFYAYVRFYQDGAAAQRAFSRLLERGNKAVLTQVPKGLVLWVLEPDARLATQSSP